MAEAQQFQAILEQDENSEATGIRVPFNVQEIFGTRARLAVCGTLNGFPYRSSIFPYSGIYYLVVNKEMRAGAGVKGGDLVTVIMEPDTAPRVITPPPDLAAALAAHPAAQATWDGLSYTHRRDHVRALEEAKRPETRARRLEKALADLAAGKKPLR